MPQAKANENIIKLDKSWAEESENATRQATEALNHELHHARLQVPNHHLSRAAYPQPTTTTHNHQPLPTTRNHKHIHIHHIYYCHRRCRRLVEGGPQRLITWGQMGWKTSGIAMGSHIAAIETCKHRHAAIGHVNIGMPL